MEVQGVRIDYGLGCTGADEPFCPAPVDPELPTHFTRIHGSVMIRVVDEHGAALLTVTSERERLDEGFIDLCRALRTTVESGDGWSRGVMLGIEGQSLILRGSRARFFKVGLKAFAEELFGAARRLYEDVHPALGPLARRSMKRYLERVEEVERDVRTGLERLDN